MHRDRPLAARRQRVAPMSPNDRRAAIVAATIPLLAEHGPRVTTRQIADAAGIAEGTIFRVFPDKPSLILATAVKVLDPEPAVRALAEIDRTADLRTRVLASCQVLHDHISNTRPLLLAARHVVAQCAMTQHSDPMVKVHQAVRHARRAITQSLTAILAPDANRLRADPETVARLLFAVALAAAGPFGTELGPLRPEQIVNLLLDGLLLP